MNRKLISKALQRRLAELCGRVAQLDPQSFGATGDYVFSVKELLRGGPQDLKERLLSLTPPDEWAEADGECLNSLKLVSLGGQCDLKNQPQPPIDSFLEQLKAAAGVRRSMFQLLAERYAWPLNFSFSAEDEAREFVLTKVMVADRSRIKTAPITAVESREFLLKLNLIAVHAATGNDLRFLDALNYYYELLPAKWYPGTETGWLWPSCLALYARALNSWS